MAATDPSMTVEVAPEGVASHQLEQDYPNPLYAWYFMSIIFFGAGFAFIDRIIVSLITPALQADIGLSDTQIGLVQGMAFALFYTLFGIPLGLLADRWSRKRLLTIGMSIWSLATTLCGFAGSFRSLFSARLGVGMGEASLNPCVASLIGDLFPPRKRPRAFSIYVVAQGFGHGLAYIFGGMLLGWLITRDGLQLPALGHFKPWQAMFVIVGVAGLIPAILLAFTVREPKRREFANTHQGRASAAQVWSFIRQNRGTMFCHHLGVALTIMTAYAFSNWMPTFFFRVHGWAPQHFSVIYGSIMLVLGIATPLASGWIVTWLKDRGWSDATWKVAIIGSIGCTSCGVIAPLMPTPELSLFVYVLAGIFASPVALAALIIISEFVPNEMRGTITGIYFLVIGLLSTGLGPFAVGFATDYLFVDKAAIGSSLSLVSLVTGLPSALLLMLGLKSFRGSLSRATWVGEPAVIRH